MQTYLSLTRRAGVGQKGAYSMFPFFDWVKACLTLLFSLLPDPLPSTVKFFFNVFG